MTWVGVGVNFESEQVKRWMEQDAVDEWVEESTMVVVRGTRVLASLFFTLATN